MKINLFRLKEVGLKRQLLSSLLVCLTLSILLLANYPSELKSAQSTSNKPTPIPQETQSIRNASVDHLQIFPGDTTLNIDQPIVFTGITYDKNNVPIGGVHLNWHLVNDQGQEQPLVPEGMFVASQAGNFKVTADDGAHKAEAKIKVLPGTHHDVNQLPQETKQVSPESSRILSIISSKFSLFRQPPNPNKPTGNWNETNVSSAFNPDNQRGSNPLNIPPQNPGKLDTNITDNPGSGNYQLVTPVINQPGRGLDLSLNLLYNSQVWSQGDIFRYFDLDHDWPAPGWSLGFGKLIKINEDQSMLVEANGARHPYDGTSQKYSDSTYKFTGHTTDGTFIDYQHFINSSGELLSAQASYPNGQVIEFSVPDKDRGILYPSRIMDANGNYITITYRNNTGPELETVTDTLGRTINFYYDANNLLTAIAGPSYKNMPRAFVRLHYTQREVDLAYTGVPFFGPRTLHTWLIDAIYYPSTSVGYWFGDPDSYTSYGIAAKVSQRHAMSFSANSLTEQGSVNPGIVTRERTYNYPPKADIIDLIFSKLPAYTQVTETWQDMDAPPAITQYQIQKSGNPRTVTTIYPDGTKNIQYSDKDPNDKFDDNLVYQQETYDPKGVLLQTQSFNWEAGDYGSPRLKRIEVTDELKQLTATEFDYTTNYNQVAELRQYGYGGKDVLKRVDTSYVTNSNYIQRHILTLPKEIQIYEGTQPSPISRTEYEYDWGSDVGTSFHLSVAPGVVQHDQKFNWAQADPSGFDPSTNYRGNITKITSYSDAANKLGPNTENRGYDITGNLTGFSRSTSSTIIQYNVDTQYSYPNTISANASNPYCRVHCEASFLTTSASYDFNTGLLLSTTDPDQRTTTAQYYFDTLRPWKITLPAGATNDYSYDDRLLQASMTSTEVSGSTTSYFQKFNGLGLVQQEEQDLANLNPVLVQLKYDNLGRLWKQTRPYSRDRQTTPQWTELFYDSRGRVVDIKAPDGSEQHYFFNEPARPVGASNLPGQTLRIVDAWGRERWMRSNTLNQLEEVVEPNPDGPGSLATSGNLITTYRYNGLGLLTEVLQGSQSRLFRYDGLGRLTNEYLPERLATLDDTGRFVGAAGHWSDVFSYENRAGNLYQHIDARGVKTNYDYRMDPLNRLKSVSYDISSVGDTSNPVLPAAPVQYNYASTGDYRRLAKVKVDGVSEETYDYFWDDNGSHTQYTLSLTNQPIPTRTMAYFYDSIDRLKKIEYPEEYGVAGTPKKSVTYEYDDFFNPSSKKQPTGPTKIQVDGADYASTITYNAEDEITSMKLGASGPLQLTENYSYDNTTGLLTQQKLARGSTPLINLSYDYLASGNNGSQGRTGQLVKLTDNLDQNNNQNYEYDALGRLVRVTGPDYQSVSKHQWDQEYTYDAYGNRTSSSAFLSSKFCLPIPPLKCYTIPVIPSQDKQDGLDSLTYDTKTNRITTAGFTYDAAGNLTRSQRADGKWQRYQYDAAGRLAKVLDDNGNTIESYIYGASNQRLVTLLGDSASANRVYYTWSGNSVIAEYVYNNSNPSSPTSAVWSKSYIYLGNRLLSSIEPGNIGSAELVQFYHPGRIGTQLISRTTDASVSKNENFPFGGGPKSDSTLLSNPKFTSYNRSATTGLDYAENRFYDPLQGRFTQVDPLEMNAVSLNNPQSFNLYSYVLNDPINFTDPLGLEKIPGCKPGGPEPGGGPCIGSDGQIQWNPGDETEAIGRCAPGACDSLPPDQWGRIPTTDRGRGGGGGGDKSGIENTKPKTKCENKSDKTKRIIEAGKSGMNIATSIGTVIKGAAVAGAEPAAGAAIMFYGSYGFAANTTNLIANISGSKERAPSNLFAVGALFLPSEYQESGNKAADFLDLFASTPENLFFKSLDTANYISAGIDLLNLMSTPNIDPEIYNHYDYTQGVCK